MMQNSAIYKSHLFSLYLLTPAVRLLQTHAFLIFLIKSSDLSRDLLSLLILFGNSEIVEISVSRLVVDGRCIIEQGSSE